MAYRTFRLYDVRHTEFADFFKELLATLKCRVIEERVMGNELRLIAVNRKRSSMATAILANLFGGSLFLRTRIGIEAYISDYGENISISLAVKPYMSVLDLEDDRAGQAHRERCQRMLEFLAEKIRERYGSLP